jgi:glycosyltransferase involved in cell wall biosynthesis
MRIAIVGPPFIPIPPRRYGGTELFIANLACELHSRGHSVLVYGNGDSRLPCRVRWRYAHADWPLDDPTRAQLKSAEHAGWAVHDAAASNVDILHLNDVAALPFTRFVNLPTMLTLHHPHEAALSDQYVDYPSVDYVAIGSWLARREPMPRMHVIHHGIPLTQYTCSNEKDDYVAFLGRMAPCKGPHLAIDAARRAGVHLKLAGEIQPVFREYWEREVLPRIDGRQIEYVGEADHQRKNELLSRARALLFPIQWEEPFGLVMVEAMACGTPVLAFRGGSVDEIVCDGVNGWICRDVEDMAARIHSLPIPARSCRDTAARRFSADRMASEYETLYRRMLARAGAPARARSSPVAARMRA